MDASHLLPRDIQALVRFIDGRRDIPHAWAKGRDCVSFAFGAVEAQTGVDLLTALPSWSTQREALQVARGQGGLTNALNDRMDPISPALAQKGDIAGLVDRAFGVRLMVIEGATLIGPGENGHQRLPRRAMVRAWNAQTARSFLK